MPNENDYQLFLSDAYDDYFYRELDKRMKATCFQQFTPRSDTTGSEIDPITGREVLKNTARSQRTCLFKLDKKGEEQPVTPVDKCHFCQGQTPITLFYILEPEPREENKISKIGICQEQFSITTAMGILEKKI